MIVLRVSYLLLSVQNVHEMDCLREETVPVPGHSGAQSFLFLSMHCTPK